MEDQPLIDQTSTDQPLIDQTSTDQTSTDQTLPKLKKRTVLSIWIGIIIMFVLFLIFLGVLIWLGIFTTSEVDKENAKKDTYQTKPFGYTSYYN